MLRKCAKMCENVRKCSERERLIGDSCDLRERSRTSGRVCEVLAIWCEDEREILSDDAKWGILSCCLDFLFLVEKVQVYILWRMETRLY